MENKFQIKTKEEFEKLIGGENAVKVNFECQFERLLNEGELIFVNLSDGYGVVRLKKTFGLSRTAKPELYILNYEKGHPEISKNKDVEAALRFFEHLHAAGNDFFYVKGLR